MVPSPTGTANPLQLLGRPDDRVVSDGVVRRVVEVVGPLINLVRVRFSESGGWRRADVDDDAARSEDPHHFGPGNVHRIRNNDQVDKIVDIGQVPASQLIDGHRPVDAQRTKTSACLFDAGRIAVKPLHQESTGPVKSGHQFCRPP